MTKRMTPSILSNIISDSGYRAFLYKQFKDSKNLAGRDSVLTMLNAASMLKDQKIKSYVVSDSLCHALSEVDCEEVGPWHLQGVQAYNFLLKKNVLKDENCSYREIFVTILPPGSSLGYHKNEDKDLYHIAVSLQQNEGQEPGDHMCYFGAKFKAGSTIEEMLDYTKPELGDMQVKEDHTRKSFRLILNLILYVHTPDPEIMVLKPQVYNTKSFREEYFQKSKNETLLQGIYSLGWDFHGREYSVNMSTRKGHYRWQACGKQWCERKLIFLDAMVVKYKGKDNA